MLRLPKFNHRGFVQLLPVLVMAVLVVGLVFAVTSIKKNQDLRGKAAENSLTPLGFGTQTGYDASGWRCRFTTGAINEYSTANYLTFSSNYSQCKSQFFSDIDYWGRNGIRSVRIWPLISQFIYDPTTQTYTNVNQNIQNLDEILAHFAQNNIKVELVLNTIYNCNRTTGNEFDYRLFTNTQLQTPYLEGMRQFLDHYKNNTTIVAYDLLNEAPGITVDSYLANVINQPSACMTASKDQISQFLLQIYQKAKSTDMTHKFTYSFPGYTTGYDQFFNPMIDFYDLHMYIGGSQVYDQSAYYQYFPATFLKPLPVIHGEAGVYSDGNDLLKDSSGQACDSVPFSVDYPRPANDDCQQKLLLVTQTFVNLAKQRGVDTVFSFNFNHTNRFVYRTYTYKADNTVDKISYASTKAGDYLCAVILGSVCLTSPQTPSPSLTQNPTPSPSATPIPSPIVPPAAPTNLRATTIQIQNRIMLTWQDNASDETYYELRWYDATAPANVRVVTLPANTMRWYHERPRPNTMNFYSVRACKINAVCSSVATTTAGFYYR